MLQGLPELLSDIIQLLTNSNPTQMLVICINDKWDYPEGNETPKQGEVYEVVKTRKGVSSGEYYVLKGFSPNEGWTTAAFTIIHTPNERITKDIEAPKASSGPVREEAPANC